MRSTAGAATATAALDRPRLGIALRIVSGVLMAGMLVSVKMVSDAAALGEIVFYRAFFALGPLVLFLWLRGEFPRGLATRRPLGHLWRAGFGAAALFCAFAAVARLNVAEAVLIAQLAPVLLTIAGVAVLGEPPTRWRVGGVVLGFVGVAVLLWPELGDALAADGVSHRRMIGVGFGVVSAALSAFALIMVRRLNTTESPGSIALYFVVAAMIAGLATLPLGWRWPGGEALVWLIASGLLGGGGHIAMTLSFRYAQASALAPFEYIALLWPLAADIVLFQAAVPLSLLLALPIIAGGAGLAAWEQRR